MVDKDKSLQEQVDQLLDDAEKKGLKTNFFFRTTLKRYQVQMKLLSDLEKVLDEDGTTVTKEYVKGRKNIYTHPAITEYNKTATAANGTVSTLINIVKAFSGDSSDAPSQGSKLQGLMDAINRMPD